MGWRGEGRKSEGEGRKAGGGELRQMQVTIYICYHMYQPHSFYKSERQIIHQSLEVLARAVSGTISLSSEPCFSLCVK